MSEVSDAWRKGFETGNKAVRKLADKELAKLRAENERLRALLGESIRFADASQEDLEMGKLSWDSLIDEWMERARKALKEGK